MHTNICKHFNWAPGAGRPDCKAGVDIRALVGGNDFGWLKRTPCTLNNRTNVTCEQFEAPTEEEVAKYQKDMAELMQYGRMLTASIRDTTQGTTNTSGTVLCPKCGGGVAYTIAGNGHVAADCATGGCLYIRE